MFSDFTGSYGIIKKLEYLLVKPDELMVVIEIVPSFFQLFFKEIEC
jgi:hypothetical protein